MMENRRARRVLFEDVVRRPDPRPRDVRPWSGWNYPDEVYLRAPISGPHGFVSSGTHQGRFEGSVERGRLFGSAIVAVPALTPDGRWVERTIVVHPEDVTRRNEQRPG